MSPLPPSPQSPPSSKALSEERTKAPKVILDRLLALSNDLVIEGEVTPVQAWNRMQREPLFGRLRLDMAPYCEEMFLSMCFVRRLQQQNQGTHDPEIKDFRQEQKILEIYSAAS
ncbi:1ab7437a-3831-4774-8c5f-a19f54f9efde [Thermothielavioides terrestris]|uniref:1ab7437a-3831-4774-8c5f-a19f54f9efde n=1 Tax=Thermothielavioides terrestris TaxID=2587410 RepID=A0A446BP40_9PEZI|nr:1ab7437a-3831-4774-8c5f-a19f54f9efde [Thermothielavioides terrestris]